MLVDLFAELATNNLEKPGMPFRMSRELKFWVEVECDQQDPSWADDRDVAAILREHALLHADDHALAVDVGGLERRHLGRAQAGAISHAERRLVLEAWRRLQEP